MLNIYVTGVEQNSNKIYVTSGLAATMQSLGYSTSIYKPIQTSGIEINGFMQSPDLTYIKTIDPYINTHFTYFCQVVVRIHFIHSFINMTNTLSPYCVQGHTSDKVTDEKILHRRLCEDCEMFHYFLR